MAPLIVDTGTVRRTRSGRHEFRPLRVACRVPRCTDAAVGLLGVQGFKGLDDPNCVGAFCAEHGEERLEALDR